MIRRNLIILIQVILYWIKILADASSEYKDERGAKIKKAITHLALTRNQMLLPKLSTTSCRSKFLEIVEIGSVYTLKLEITCRLVTNGRATNQKLHSLTVRTLERALTNRTSFGFKPDKSQANKIPAKGLKVLIDERIADRDFSVVWLSFFHSQVFRQ